MKQRKQTSVRPPTVETGSCCRWETTPMGSRESLSAVAGRGGREKRGSNRQYMIPLPRFGPRRCIKPYSCFGGLYVCVLELAMGREELQKAESSSWSPGASFYRERRCHSGTQEVERVRWCEVIPRIT